MKKLLSIVLFTTIGLRAAQPEIFNYTTDNYIGHSINYSAIEDSTGIMYIANAYSVLEFDGINWRRIGVNNGQSPSCFTKDKTGKIFVGSFGDIGYLDKDALGNTQFNSLKSKITEANKKIGVVYQVAYHNGEIYFCSYDAIYIYNGKNVAVIHPALDEQSNYAQFGFMGIAGNELLVYESKRGLGKIENGNFVKIIANSSATPQSFCGYFKNGDNDYTLFSRAGIVHLKEGQISNIQIQRSGIPEKSLITCAISIGNNQFALGTEDAGVLICDAAGNILKTFNKKSGLKSNNIKHLYLDAKGDLWAPMNNGVALIKLSATYEFINELEDLEGMGYSSLLLHDTLYLGTSQGLYFAPNWSVNKTKSFEKVKGIGLFAYSIKAFKGRILCSDENELYELQGTKSTRISDGSGRSAWVVKRIPNVDTLLLCGTYDDLRIYAYRKNHWVYRNTIAGFKESSRMFEFDAKGSLWVVQGISGLFKIELSKDFTNAVRVENYVAKYHFSPDYFNDIVKVGHQLKISSEGGIYYLNEEDALVKDPTFSALSVSTNRLRTVEGENQTLYLIHNERPIFLRLENGKYVVSPASPNNLKDKLVGSAEYVAKTREGEYIVATQQGFALYHPKSNQGLPQCLIRSVKLLNMAKDSVLSMGNDIAMTLSYSGNNLAFYFTIPLYGAYSTAYYHSELSTNNKLVWKDLSLNPFKEFTNLPEGEYEFKVWAEMNGKMSPPATMSFTILPPWYRSKIAYVVYLLCFIFSVFFATKLIRHRFNLERKKLEEEKKGELEKRDAIYKTELLEIELQRKNDEMAFLALNYTQKKQFLTFLKSNLSNLSKNIVDDKNANELKTLIRSIAVEDKETENWEKFQMHFDKTNDNFFQKLKQLDPKMNESTMLMCSHIRMGKSNKEIADLLNISISGVEKRKYRLKDKLGIKDENSITEFISTL